MDIISNYCFFLFVFDAVGDGAIEIALGIKVIG
jgi:hypothetical protein